jgi:hypothetical protein
LNRLALSSNDDRNGVFINAAAKLNLNPALIEKDFWVSWLLDIIFNQSSFSKILMFKGGTSLSKCYGVINRFSEDIDIILDWTKLGISGEEPWHERSTTKQNAFRENINKRATEYISSVIMPELIALVQDSGLKGFKFYINQSDPHTLRFKYPKTNKYDYILDEVYLEIGPFAAWTPHEVKIIKPLLADPYPDLMDNHTISVMTVEAKRTFWEKATILHMVAHQNPNKTWHRYSNAQIEALRLWILWIGERDSIDITEGLPKWIKESGAAAFEWNEDAYYGKIKGILTHTNIRKDKFDMFPQQELLDMLVSL